ncbi:MAG: aminopeptidase N [Leptospirales bacterium]|jgi:aminopeptidase N
MYPETAAPRSTTYLADYTPPAWQAPDLALQFDLDPKQTRVHARARFSRNPDAPGEAPLVLSGEAMELISIRLDGRPLNAAEYQIDPAAHTLTLSGDLPESFELELETRIAPIKNTALEGLYMSGGKFCTQCEAQGFRRIVYFLDRPDVMARYTTTLIGDKSKFPILLSNGNPILREDLPDGRHKVVWEDPFPKPTYLFALVAGDLGLVKDAFTTRSGREIALEIYVDHGNEDRAGFAMNSLKQAMIWDEETFGLEYDLDIYMIVAVDDFNMGAMENKGLNLFNSKLVLANPRTATDDAFEFIQAVIGHEYFHNWTGNRVTCRDWFQLTLKEGLTVYRDQRFTEDMTHPAIKRIKDVTHLRVHQFPEDAGPMSHPIQPKSYIEINNFYTMTVYEKGAEVIRMIATLIGKDAFRRGMDVYFERNDGKAVTVEEFVSAMEASAGPGRDLKQFRRWYDQNGTPELTVVDEEYDPDSREYSLTIQQANPVYEKTEGEPKAGAPIAPLLIPLRLGLLDRSGKDMALQVRDHVPVPGVDDESTVTLPFGEKRATFVFQNVSETPVLSLLRGFSAPVRLNYDRDPADLAFLFAHDSDLYSRWEAGQRLMKLVVDQTIADIAAGEASPRVDPLFLDAFTRLLEQRDLDPAYLSLAMQLPSETEITAEQSPALYADTHEALRIIRRELAGRNRDRLMKYYETAGSESDGNDERATIGRRRLKNRCLAYLMSLDDASVPDMCLAQQKDAQNMTDETAALYLLADGSSAEREESLALFYERWRDDGLVIDHWFSAQALSSRSDTPERVSALRADPAFTLKNPNKVRALIGAFSRNGLRFNSGEGYALIADVIVELDPLNPGIAARLARAFNEVARLEPALKALARAELERILAGRKLSNDVFEIVSRSLQFA